MATLPPEGVTALKIIEEGVQQLAQKGADAQAEVEKNLSALETLQATMGFLDNYLFGIFGNRAKIDARNALETAITKHSHGAFTYIFAEQSMDALADMVADAMLQQRDTEYQKIAALAEIRGKTASFDWLLDQAITAVNKARAFGTTELTEEATQASPNASYAERRASDAAKEARDLMIEVRHTAALFQQNIQGHIPAMGDTPEVKKLTSLMQAFNAVKLAVPLAEGPAEFDLISLRAGVKKIGKEVKVVAPHADKTARAYRNSLRRECLKTN